MNSRIILRLNNFILGEIISITEKEDDTPEDNIDQCTCKGKRVINLVQRCKEFAVDNISLSSSRLRKKEWLLIRGSQVDCAGNTYFEDVVRSSVHAAVLDSHCQLVGSLAS